MGFKVKANNSGGDGNFELPPAGSQAAVLVGLIELGHHENDYQGQSKGFQPRVFLVWELAEKKSDGSPFVVGRDYTQSLGKKANLRSIVEKWRGKTLGDDEEYDLTKLIGKPCLLSLVHKQSQNNNTYAKIDGVGALPKGMAPPKATLTPVTWEIGPDKEPPAEDWLPFVYGEPVKTVIERSREFKDGFEEVPAGAGDDDVDTEGF
jgi:hypothetical protein